MRRSVSRPPHRARRPCDEQFQRDKCSTQIWRNYPLFYVRIQLNAVLCHVELLQYTTLNALRSPQARTWRAYVTATSVYYSFLHNIPFLDIYSLFLSLSVTTLRPELCLLSFPDLVHMKTDGRICLKDIGHHSIPTYHQHSHAP